MSRLEAPPTILLNVAWEGLPAAIENARPLREIAPLRVAKFKPLIKERGLDLSLRSYFTVPQSE
ncbi:MAG: hypothetical protein DRR11_08035 [Gammaproteobacteria bacterium]|nr:MAG: hypothetical protein DRR11_08035 [Gammaproteobacteria bacterium]RLA35311.1 MAG: hypothetical protein DRR15_07770 [Gammaproteobacteria bacterium]